MILLALAAAVAPARDADTDAWWRQTVALSNDAMEGRDTGSPGYDRAAAMVARAFAAAGLKPAGESGGWFQPIDFEDRTVAGADINVGGRRLVLLDDITIDAATAPARIDAPLAYRGYCAADALGDVRGKVVICHATRRPGLPTSAERLAALRRAGAAAMIAIADPGFTIEPPRWPYAYARDVQFPATPHDPLAMLRPAADPLPTLTLRAECLGRLTAASGRDAAALVAAGAAGNPLPSFDIADHFVAAFTVTRHELHSANVVGLLPGTDPALADQAIVLSAHLDGYGHGHPVKGDAVYNGTLDDAAYVALLIRLAQQRQGRGFRRPLLFAVMTGEEKGLLGSRWFVAHPTIPKSSIAADINLDQLRPIFPLERLTVHGLDDTTLGDDARAVATGLGIQVQNDPEPERRLIQRADSWSFLAAGIPATNFVFGFAPGSESERIYRRWYVEGYHRPQDNPDQHIDWQAAADFNRFFYKLIARVADQDRAPAWLPGSKLRPAP